MPTEEIQESKCEFSYELAFSRNIGWLLESEQKELQNKTVAIAGLGGVGGIYLLTLARLGVQNFHLAEFDTFEVGNFNRQVGATMSSVGRPKLETMIKSALDINPNIKIKSFPDGVTNDNINQFIAGIDCYVDGLDFFAQEIRIPLFKLLYQNNIPATTIGPIGMGAALINFMPGKMTFEQYFGFESAKNELERSIRFITGLTPKAIHLKYLMDKSKFQFKSRNLPSTFMGCELCAGIAGTEVLKILLNRGKIIHAPSSLQFDAYTNKLAKTWIPLGYKNPLQLLKSWWVKKIFNEK